MPILIDSRDRNAPTCWQIPGSAVELLRFGGLRRRYVVQGPVWSMRRSRCQGLMGCANRWIVASWSPDRPDIHRGLRHFESGETESGIRILGGSVDFRAVFERLPRARSGSAFS